MKPVLISRHAGDVRQWEIDAFWCVLLLTASAFVTIPAPWLGREGAASLGFVLSDLALPLLCLWALYRGIFAKPSRRLVFSVAALCTAIVAQTAAAAIWGAPQAPLAMVRDTIKLVEFVLYVALLMQVFRHDQILRPSAWVVPFCFVLIAIVAAALGVQGLYLELSLFETQYASAVVSLFAVYVLLSPERSPRKVPWPDILVGLIACASCTLIPSETFLPAAAAMTCALLIRPVLQAVRTHVVLQTLVLMTAIALAFGLTLLLAATTKQSISDLFNYSGYALSARLQIWWQALELAAESFPLGIGLGQFQAQGYVEGFDLSRFRFIHNTPLTLFTELGLLGSILLVALIGAIVRALVYCTWEQRIALVGALVVPMAFHDVQSFRTLHVVLALSLVQITKRAPGQLIPESLLPVAGALTSRLLTYGTLILAARFLPGDAFGAFALGLVILNLGSAVVSGGGDMWLNRFTRQDLFAGGSPPLVWPLYLGIAMLLAALVATLTSASVALLDPLPGHATTLLLAGLAATAMGLGEAVLAVLRSARRVKLFFVLRDLVAPIGIFAGMAAMRPQTDSAAISVPFAVWGAILALSTICLVAIRGRSIGRWHWYAQALQPALRHTGALIYGNLGSRLASSLDVLMLSGITGLARAGAYRVGAQLSIGFPVVQHFMFLGLPWQLKHLSRESGVESGLETLVRRQRLLLVLAAGGLAVLGALAEWVMWLFGPDFVPFAEILRWLLVVRFADLLWGPQHEVLVSNGRAMQDAHSNLAAIGAWIVCFAAFIGFFDPLDSAVAATGLGLTAAQLFRYRVLVSAGLPSVTGLPGRYLVPLGTSLAVVATLLAVS